MDELDGIQVGDEGVIVPDITQETTDSTPNINPAWQDVLGIVPEEFHPLLTPKLSEWDKGVQTRFQKVQQQYDPYKPLVENKVPYKDVEQALQFAHVFNTNPQALFEEMKKLYGGQDASQGQKPEEEEFDLSEEPKFDIEKDPRFQQVAQQAAMASQFLTQQQQAEQEKQVLQEIESEFASVAQKYNLEAVEDEMKDDIATLALGRIAQTNGVADIAAAADIYFTRFKPAPRASDTAPPTIGGNRDLPTNAVDLDKMTQEERIEYQVNLMRAIADQAGN